MCVTQLETVDVDVDTGDVVVDVVDVDGGG